MSRPENNKKRRAEEADMIERHELEKASREETIASWMQRALYAEKQLRALETKPGAAEAGPAAPENGDDQPDDSSDDSDASEPIKTLKLSRKERLKQAGSFANSFLEDTWLAQKEPFRSKSADVYHVYHAWCKRNSIPEVFTHCLFNKHMAKLMPNGYTVTRGSGNKAVITFDYNLAVDDFKNQK